MKPEEQRFALLRLHSEGQPVGLCVRSVSHRGGLSAGTADLGGAGGEGGFAFSPAAPLPWGILSFSCEVQFYSSSTAQSALLYSSLTSSKKARMGKKEL